MKHTRKLLFLFALHPIFADKLLLKNGSFAEGKVEAENSDYVIFSGKDDIPKKVPRSEIREVIHDGRPAQPVGPGKPAQGTPGLTLFDVITLRNFTGALTFGWQATSLDDLNSTLSPLGYQKVPEQFFTLGGIAQLTISRVVLGLEGTWLWGAGRVATVGGNSLRNSFSAFRSVGILGYLVYAGERLEIFPYIGGGFAGYNLIMTNTATDSFGNIAATGQRSAILSSLSFLFTPGVQLTYRVPFDITNKGVLGIVVGTKAGYDFGFLQSNWVSGGINDLTPVNGGPKTLLAGPYAQLLLGLWFDFY